MAFLLRRLGQAVLTLLAASVVIFAALEIVPGDPARVMLGIGATDEAVVALRERLGLDRPLPVRYLAWIGGALRGDLGTSFTYDEPVWTLVRDRIALSLPLALMSLALSTAIALPVGVLAARHRGGWADTLLMGGAQIGIAVPNFWLALLLVSVFAVTLRVIPAGGFPGWEAGLVPALRSLLLPTVALALPQAAILARVARSALLDALAGDYIRTARAKGASRRRAVWRHALRNALIPIVTILGLQFAFLLSGAIIIENVFYLPGLGRLLFQSITARDLVVVESVVLLLVAAVIAVNFLVDVAYLALDPRLRRP